MSDYVKATDFASKDTLPSGDPLKKVRGAEIDAEFTAIQTAVGTKLDKASPAMTGTPTAPTPSSASVGTQVVNAEWVRLLINTIEPIGTIKAYARPVGEIPAGWNVCDGTNGTLDLRDRFITGAGTTFLQNTAGGWTAGSLTTPVNGLTTSSGTHNHTSITGGHSLVISEMPAHNHTAPMYNEQQLVGNNLASTGGPSYTTDLVTSTVGEGAPHAHTIGSDGAHVHSMSTATANIPGHFPLLFIQKIANI